MKTSKYGVLMTYLVEVIVPILPKFKKYLSLHFHHRIRARKKIFPKVRESKCRKYKVTSRFPASHAYAAVAERIKSPLDRDF